MTSALSLSKGELADFDWQQAQLRGLRLGFFQVWRLDFKIRESSSAERVGQPFGIANNDKGQLIRMNDRLVRLSG